MTADEQLAIAALRAILADPLATATARTTAARTLLELSGALGSGPKARARAELDPTAHTPSGMTAAQLAAAAGEPVTDAVNGHDSDAERSPF